MVAKDIGVGSARYAALAGQHGSTPAIWRMQRAMYRPCRGRARRLAHRSPARSGNRALPFLRDRPLSKQFENARHNPRFRNGLDGKADGDESRVAISAVSTIRVGAAPSDTDDIGQISAELMANQHGPSPFRAREANSPAAGMVCRPGHRVNVSPAAVCVNPPSRWRAQGRGRNAADQSLRGPFPDRGFG